MASIEKTPYGTWRVRWRDADGRNRARSFRVKARAQDFLGELARGDDPAPKLRLSVADAAGDWLAGAMNLGPGGLETYGRDLERYILPALGGQRLSALTPVAIERFLAEELRAGLAPSTVHRHYRTLRRLCQVAIDRGRLQRNPCDPVTPPRIPPGEMRFLTAAQVDDLAWAIGDRYRAWVLVAAWCGLRWSETVGLRRGDVDGARVTVAGQLVRRADGSWDRREPKTRAGVRTITAPASVAAYLAAHVDLYTAPGAGALVFANGRGNPMIAPSFTGNDFKPALRRAGLDPAVRIHDLRHTAVALAIAAGAHPKAIQARMGHASISVTLDRYGHLFDQADEAVAAGLDRLRVA